MCLSLPGKTINLSFSTSLTPFPEKKEPLLWIQYELGQGAGSRNRRTRAEWSAAFINLQSFIPCTPVCLPCAQCCAGPWGHTVRV